MPCLPLTSIFPLAVRNSCTSITTLSRRCTTSRYATAPATTATTSTHKRLFSQEWRHQQAYPPLRILFCGSDHFSATSLNALHREHLRNPSLIESIDVVCRKWKRFGRGLKTIKEGMNPLPGASVVDVQLKFHAVPIKFVAQELGLPTHEIDTFRGWRVLLHPPM